MPEKLRRAARRAAFISLTRFSASAANFYHPDQLSLPQRMVDLATDTFGTQLPNGY